MNNTPHDSSGASIVYWTNGYGIPAGEYSIATTATYDGSVLDGHLSANLTGSAPASGSKYRVMYESHVGLFANGPM